MLPFNMKLESLFLRGLVVTILTRILYVLVHSLNVKLEVALERGDVVAVRARVRQALVFGLSVLLEKIAVFG